jgi:hypothetical protein
MCMCVQESAGSAIGAAPVHVRAGVCFVCYCLRRVDWIITLGSKHRQR